MLEKAEGCCTFVLGALEGSQGFLTEVLSLGLFIIFFFFLAKWILDKLGNYFEKKEKPWHEGFIRALTLPLTAYAWFFAFLHAIELIGVHFFSTPIFENLNLWLKIGGVLTFIWFLLRWKKNIVKIMVKKSKNHEINIEPGKLDVINKITTVALFFLAFLMLLEVTHSSLNTLIAFGGIGGLALAFASQEIIANFFSGAMIYLTQPFLVGDRIHVPEKNVEGYVEDIGWYMTRIRTVDKRPIYIPNSIFSKIVVITPSRMTHRQIKETFGLKYADMPKIAPLIQDIKEMLGKHPDIDKRQPISVYLNTFAVYSLDILISAYTKTTSTDSYFELRQNILLNIYELIEKHGAKAAVPITYVEIVALPPLNLKKDTI